MDLAEATASKLAEQLGYFTEDEFRALAGITPSTAEAWRKRGKGPTWARLGTRVYYPRAAVLEFLAAAGRQPRIGPGSAVL